MHGLRCVRPPGTLMTDLQPACPREAHVGRKETLSSVSKALGASRANALLRRTLRDQSNPNRDRGQQHERRGEPAEVQATLRQRLVQEIANGRTERARQ